MKQILQILFDGSMPRKQRYLLARYTYHQNRIIKSNVKLNNILSQMTDRVHGMIEED